MEAIERRQVLGKRFSTALALLVLALLTSAAIGYLIRFATAPTASVTPAQHASAVAPSSSVGDRWWQDTSAAAQPPAVGDRWWQDGASAAPAPALSGDRRIDRG